MMVRVIQRQWVVLEEREGGLLPGSPEAVAAIERVGRDPKGPNMGDPESFQLWPADLRAAFYRGEYHRPTPTYRKSGNASTATPPAWSIKEPDSPEFRTCEKCGAAVRGKNRCKPCAAEATRTAHLERARVKHLKPRICEVCRADITGYGSRSIRCRGCQAIYERQVLKAKNAKRDGRSKPVDPDVVLPRPCKRCGGPIKGKRANAIMCHACTDEVERIYKKKDTQLRNAKLKQQRAERRMQQELSA